MEGCTYTQVLRDAGIEHHEYDKNTWKPLFRQTILNLGVCCAYFMIGLFLGAPTVMIAQIKRDPNSTEIITDEKLSWISSVISITSLPFVIILPWLFHQIGRRLAFLMVWLSVTVGFIIFYVSTNVYHIIISEVFAGFSGASIVTITPVFVSEYTSPRYRGIFLTLKSASIFWGIWVSNAVGTFFPWKKIAVVAFVCATYIVSVIIWPESPYWLAMKERYIESAKAHRWLKGVNENSEKELAQLISSQKKIHCLSLPQDSWFDLRNLWLTITSRPFYKPALLSFILIAQCQYSGKLIITMYAIDALKHLTSDESFVYIEMLVLDGITVFSMYVGCILSRYYKRRTLLLFFSSIGISLLFILSIYSYLLSISIIEENNIVLISLLSSYSLTISFGPMILSTSIYGEIMPTRYSKYGMMLIGLGASINMSILLKISPFMFRTLKMHGCFLFYGICSTFFLTIIYFYLPETKDKTIQEIEEYFAETKPLLKLNTRLLQTRKFNSRISI